MDSASMNGFTPPAAARFPPRNVFAFRRRFARVLWAAGASVLLWSGCVTTPGRRTAAPTTAQGKIQAKSIPAPLPPSPKALAVKPAQKAGSAPSPASPELEPPTVGPKAIVERLPMWIESDPAGATIVVDGRPVGKTPLELGVPATVLGFFRNYMEIRARFIAENEEEASQTAIEDFSPREKVPITLHFTPAGAQRTLR